MGTKQRERTSCPWWQTVTTDRHSYKISSQRTLSLSRIYHCNFNKFYKSKKFRHLKNCYNYHKIWTMWFYHRVMCTKDAYRMANSVDSDQTALADRGPHCLPRPVCPNTEDHYSIVSFRFELRLDKTNKVTVHPAKTQISLGIRPVWSESSLSAWRNLGSLTTHWSHSEDSDQTGRMPRLIWVFAGRTATLLVLSCRGSFLCFSFASPITICSGLLLIGDTKSPQENYDKW